MLPLIILIIFSPAHHLGYTNWQEPRHVQRDSYQADKITYILYFNKYNHLRQKMFVRKTSLWNKNTALQHSQK